MRNNAMRNSQNPIPIPILKISILLSFQKKINDTNFYFQSVYNNFY